MSLSFLSITTIVIFLLLEGLFSGGELALVASDRNKIRHKAKRGSRSAKVALKLLNRPDWFFSTTLTGTNLCVIINTSLATALFIGMFGLEKGELISIAVMIPLILIMGEIVPKSIFQRNAERVALRISWFIWISSFVLLPLVFLLSRITSGAVHLFTEQRGTLYPRYITKSGLEYLLQNDGDRSDIMASEKDMIRRIFDFTDATVDRVMVPLSNVTALSEKTSLREATTLAAERGFSRLPVYRDQSFNIIGILHSFELLKVLHEKDGKAATFEKGNLVEQCMKTDILYVPETKLAGELFLEMQSRRQHMAVVVDEYGGAVGIITIEDILEEIVGEIEDEYHHEEQGFYRKMGPGKYRFKASTKIEHVCELVPLDIPAGDYETLGGFLLHRMGHIPKRHETLKEGQCLFVIEDADVKSIREVLVIIPPGMEIGKGI